MKVDTVDTSGPVASEDSLDVDGDAPLVGCAPGPVAR